jgi:hypothetical protein
MGGCRAADLKPNLGGDACLSRDLDDDLSALGRERNGALHYSAPARMSGRIFDRFVCPLPESPDGRFLIRTYRPRPELRWG